MFLHIIAQLSLRGRVDAGRQVGDVRENKGTGLLESEYR